MGEWSVTSGERRLIASPRICCARAALIAALFSLLLPAAALAQAPELRLPGNVEVPANQFAPGNLAAKKSAVPKAKVKQQTDPAPSASKESDDLDTALQRKGDLNLHGLSLNAALFTIGEQWNINIVAGDLQGNVNGVFKQAPLREILDAILLSNGYNYRAVGKSLVISTVADLGQVNPFFQSATIPVQSADIDEVMQGAQLLTTPKGQVRAMKSAHSIVVLDFPDRVKMIREFIATLETAGSGRFPSAEARNGVPLEVGYFRTQHISAKTAEQALQAVLSKEGRVGVLEKEDRLLVTDYAENLAMVEKVLERIDQPRPQVRITALIYDISLQDIERLGINWSPTVKTRIDVAGDPGTSLGAESVTAVPFPTGTVGNTLTFTNLSRNFDLTAIAMCLQSAKDARLLADPSVSVLENEEAVFEKVSEIPYQQLTQTQQGGEIGTTAFKKAGITLHVRPKIAADGIIRMDVNPEVSRLTGFTPGDNQPIIDTSSATTVLTVANRQTVVIGGLRQRSDVGEFNGVPYLKDLKGIGRLFRSRDIDVRESELVVFIMPEIISYGDEPNCRQKIAAETIECRLDQVPEAEGCPPCCQRLPPGAFGGPMYLPTGEPTFAPAGEPTAVPNGEPTVAPANELGPADGNYAPEFEPLEKSLDDALPLPPQVDPPAPMSAAQIPSAEFQFGVAGRSEEVRAMIADGRLRRLPVVARAATPANSSAWIGKVTVDTLFRTTPEVVVTPASADDAKIRTAKQVSPAPVRR
jgi:general secretion pathway protein D